MGGRGSAPDEADELIVGGKVPVLTGGFGVGVDIEAAEEAVDAVVGESTLAEKADFVLQADVGGRFGDGREAERRFG